MKNSELAIFGGTKSISKPFKRYNPIGKEETEAAIKVLKTGKLSPFLGQWTSDAVLGGFYGGIVMAGFGYLMGEAVTRSTNYRRGTPLIVASVVGMIVALVAFVLLLGGAPLPFELLGIGAGTYLAITRVR